VPAGRLNGLKMRYRTTIVTTAMTTRANARDPFDGLLAMCSLQPTIISRCWWGTDQRRASAGPRGLGAIMRQPGAPSSGHLPETFRYRLLEGV
jgi:hypothetical protein